MLRLERRAVPSRTAQLAAPLLAVVFTLLVTSLLVAWAGAPVTRAYALLIEGGVQTSTPTGLEAVYAEVRVPRYRRSFTLSRELDTTRIEASLKDGVLTLRIPKQAHAQPRRIQVTPG